MFKKLIGSTLNKIFFSSDYLILETDKGTFTYTVYGDCCSRSVFYDFIGVKKILNKKIVEVKRVLDVGDDNNIEDENDYNLKKHPYSSNDSIKVYGYRITVEDKEFEELSAVFSFRNYSNGYYGGEMEEFHGSILEIKDSVPEIKDDVLETI